MTISQWNEIEKTVTQMNSEERERLVALLNKPSADMPSAEADPLLGLFASDSALIDEVVEDAHAARESHPLRSDH